MNETVNQLKNMKEQKSSIDYGKLLKDLLKHKKLFCKVLAITFVVACVYAMSLPSYYKCEVTLSPEMSTTRSSSSLSALASSFGVNLKGMGNNSEAPDAIPGSDEVYKVYGRPLRDPSDHRG